MDDDETAIEDAVRSAITQALNGTGYLPSEGCLVTDAVAIIGYVDLDGGHGWSMVRAGSPWATRGLVVMAADAADGDYAVDSE